MGTVAKPEEAFLSEHDFTAVSFWTISIAMIAATVFFYAEAGTVSSHWKSSLHGGGLVTLVAAVHYKYMREYWVCVHKSPIVYRYIDWSITVPLQMIEFNLILKAAKAPIGPEGFWRLLIGTVLMLAFGYAGETKAVNPTLGFALGMAGWAFILFEIFVGESANASGKSSEAVQQAFNKIAFVLACWSCAKADSEAKWGPTADIVSCLRSELQAHAQTSVSEFGGKSLTSVANQLSKLDMRQQQFDERVQKALLP